MPRRAFGAGCSIELFVRIVHYNFAYTIAAYFQYKIVIILERLWGSVENLSRNIY